MEKKELSPEAQARAINCLKKFGERLRGMPQGAVRAVETGQCGQRGVTRRRVRHQGRHQDVGAGCGVGAAAHRRQLEPAGLRGQSRAAGGGAGEGLTMQRHRRILAPAVALAIAVAAGGTFTARIEVLESMGSDSYAYFSVGGDRAASDALAELAAEHVEHHRRFLVADGVVLLICLPRELRDRVILLGPDVHGVA